MANILTYPDALELASNLKKFVISSTEDIRFKLYCGATLIIDESYSPASDGKITIDVKEVVKNELSLIIPTTDIFLQTGICKQFVAHIDLETKTFLAIRAGVENLAVSATEFLTQNFLTWQPQSKQVGYSQPEWLTYYAPVAGNLKVKFYLSDNTSVVQPLTALVAGSCTSINMMFSRIMALQAGEKYGYFDVWFENAAAARLTYIQRYIYNETEAVDEHFLFENSLGGIDTAVFSGESIFAPELTHTEGMYEEESEQLDDTVSRLFQKSTGWKSKIEAAWLWDFFRAIRKYKVDSGVIRKITLKESEVKDSTNEDMKSFSFTYRIASDKGLLNIQRSTDPLPENLEITTPEGLFFLAPRLVDFPSAELLDELIIPAQSPFTEVWKRFSIGSLKSWIMSFVSTSEIGTSSHNHVNKSILDKISALLGSNDAGAVTEGSVFSGLRSRKEFLRKDVADTAAEKITFTKGIKSDAIESKDISTAEFTPGFAGTGFSLRKDEDGRTYLDVDELLVRQSAKFYELIIQQLKHQGGIVFYTAASIECLSVTEQADSYRCFFDTKDGQLTNEWAVNDQARCQRFAGKYYWRLVVAVGEDYIDLSKADTNGAGIPEAGDVIVQLGNRTDTGRQAAKVTTVVGVNSPRDEYYEGISSYNLTGKLITIVGIKDGKAGIYTNYGEFAGKVTVGAGSSGLTELSEWAAAAQDIQDAQSTANQGVQAAANAQSFIDNTLPPQIAALQAQIDGQVENWFYPYVPSLANFPASDWTTAALKNQHTGDTFTNTQEFIDEATTPNAGKAWRFVNTAGVYSWTPIADSDAVKALLAASKAQDTADGKRRVFVVQPTTPYDVGDLWSQGSAGELLRCISQRLTGAYVAGDWDKAVKYTDDTMVNNLQIGGRNYIRNGNFSNDIAYFILENNLPKAIQVIDGKTCFYFNGVSFYTNGYLRVIRVENLTVGGQYTLSFLVKRISGDIRFDPDSAYNFDETILSTLNVWVKITRTFTAASNVLDLTFYGTATSPGTYYLTELQLEKSNKATDWTASLEDTQASIAAAKATADEAAAVTSKFGTTIDGGLVSAAMVKLRDPLTADGAEMAGMNGGKGNGSNPAFWAGGNYTQALQDLAAIIFRHSGAAKIGELHIEENGVITIKDAVTGQIRLMFNASELPLLSTLLDSAQITGSQYNSGVSLTDTGSSIRPNTLSVTQANSKLSLVGGWSISALAPTTGTALVYAHIYILKDGAFYTSVKSVNLTLNVNNLSEDITEAINFSLSSVPTGGYSVAVDLSISEDGSHDTSVNLTLDESTLSFVFEKDIKQVRFGTDGQMLFYATDKYLYLTSKPGGPFIKSRGEWDVPGLRCAANITSGGGLNKTYGITIDSVLTSAGLYTITHNIGHTNYSVNLTVINASGRINAVVTAKNNNDFTVRIVNVYTDALTSSAFDLTIYANG